MLTGINKVFGSIRAKLGSLMKVAEVAKTAEQTVKEAIMNPVQSAVEESPVVKSTDDAARVQERRKRIQARTHKCLLNRNDRRFLKVITGETYKVDSKTTTELYQRIQFLKNVSWSKEKKRARAELFLTTGKW